MNQIHKNSFVIFISIYLLMVIFLMTQVHPDTTIFHAYQRYFWVISIALAFSYLLIGPDIHTYIRNKKTVYYKILKIITLFVLNFIFLQLGCMYLIEKNHKQAPVQKHMIEKIYEYKGCHFTDIKEPLEKRIYSICLEDFDIKEFEVPKKIWVIFGYHALGAKIVKIKE